ncbi:hypothetical protein ACFPM0_19940 [Pseudonocardia sulfidoxydans]|uniref:hypothetical protein n=1 Tax=Pseudonocardia sulfidoxydans TaxID=54011 RepID=UPI00361B41BA
MSLRSQTVVIRADHAGIVGRRPDETVTHPGEAAPPPPPNVSPEPPTRADHTLDRRPARERVTSADRARS